MDSRVATYEHVQQVQRILGKVVADLLRRAEVHDQSKLVSPEVEAFDEYTERLRGSTYGSDEYKRFLAELKPALDHHYAANSHHPQHYRWHCPVCSGQFNEATYEASPQGPNESGVRYCPQCCRHGMLYESELMAAGSGIRGMSLLDVLEMLCDWKAATLRHADGDIRRSVELNQKRFGYSDELKTILLNTLPLIEG